MARKKDRLRFIKETCDPLRALFPRDEFSLGRVNLWSVDWPDADGLFVDPDDHEAWRIYHRKVILKTEIAHHIWDRYLHYRPRRPENPKVADQVSRENLDATAIFIEKEQRELGIRVFDAKTPGYDRRWDGFIRTIGIRIWESWLRPPECAPLPPNFDDDWTYMLKKLEKRQESSNG